MAPQQLIYQGKNLIKQSATTGGKNANSSELNGKYKSDDSSQTPYFIKLPTDKSELFVEFFMGQLLENMLQWGLIPKEYNEAFVRADLIQLEKGRYALIQPFVEFTELYKLTQTSDYRGGDRSPWYEFFFLGSRIRQVIQKMNEDKVAQSGLSYSLFMSLLLGDYSVHTGNMVVIQLEEKKVLFARIDFGAGLRNFANPLNNKDILENQETQSIFNRHKQYIKYYAAIPGLFHQIVLKSEAFAKTMEEINNALYASLKAALQCIPNDLLSSEEQKNLATYLGIEAFSAIKFDGKKTSGMEDFINKFIKTMKTRLGLFKALKVEKQEGLFGADPGHYQSFIEQPPSLSKQDTIAPKQPVEPWAQDFFGLVSQILSRSNQLDFNINSIDINMLKNRYTEYLIQVTENIDQSGLFSGEQNILASMINDKVDNFLPKLKEGFILRKIYHFDNVDNLQVALANAKYDELSQTYIKQNPNSKWAASVEVLHSAFYLIGAIQSAQNLTQTEELDQGINLSQLDLRSYARAFVEAQDKLEKLIKQKSNANLQPHNVKSHFYPYSIEDQDLRKTPHA